MNNNEFIFNFLSLITISWPCGYLPQDIRIIVVYNKGLVTRNGLQSCAGCRYIIQAYNKLPPILNNVAVCFIICLIIIINFFFEEEEAGKHHYL